MRKWKIIPPAVAIICFYLFYSMNSGITITNDGSHFSLFDSLVTTGSPELKQVRQFAFGDSAEYQGKFYSDRNPGLALFTAVFYQATKVLEPWMKPLNLDPKFTRNYDQAQKHKIRVVMLVPPLFGGLVFLFTYLLVREMGVGYISAFISSLAMLFGTISLRYATVFYSHILASALLVFGLLLVIGYKRSDSFIRLWVAIFLFSCAVLVEHLLILVFLPLFVYLLVDRPRSLLRPFTVMGVAIAGFLPMLVLMAYNWTCFDSPFSIAHFHHASDAQNHELSTLLRFNQTWAAAKNLLFGAPRSEVGRQDLTGLFSASPFLYFAFIFLLLIATKYCRINAEYFLLIACIVLAMLGGASVFAPYGGWDRDYRYFVAVMPLFAPFIGVVLDFLLDRGNGRVFPYLKYLALAFFLGLLFVSTRQQFAHIRHESQIQYTHLLVNYEAALVNVSLFLVLSASVVLLLLAATKVYSPKPRRKA